MDEIYLSLKELSQKIKYSPQSLYNMIHTRVFILGEHYVKPSPKKILFKWSVVQIWLDGNTGKDNCSLVHDEKHKMNSAINI